MVCVGVAVREKSMIGSGKKGALVTHPWVGDARLSGCTPRPRSRAGVLGGVTAGAAVLSCGV
jgi:hypothetical protein